MTSEHISKHHRFLACLEPVRKGFGRFCLALTGDADDAKDLASEAILIVFERFDSLRDETKFKSYLFTTASRLARDMRRKSSRMMRITDEMGSIPSADHTVPDAHADLWALSSALQKLPAEQREAVILFEVSGYSLEEIRELQGGSLSGVKSRIARGREKLKLMLGVEKKETSVIDRSAYGDDKFPAHSLTYKATL
jgi:RNA polymerase sigma-70 factor (ECF subfamily)